MVNNPKAYQKDFVKHWESSLPDLTDVPNFGPEQLSFWIRHHKKTKKKKRKIKKNTPFAARCMRKMVKLGSRLRDTKQHVAGQDAGGGT